MIYDQSSDRTTTLRNLKFFFLHKINQFFHYASKIKPFHTKYSERTNCIEPVICSHLHMQSANTELSAYKRVHGPIEYKDPHQKVQIKGLLSLF